MGRSEAETHHFQINVIVFLIGGCGGFHFILPIRIKLMPKDPLGDVLHLALASYQKSDYLLTWNCKNLANANKFMHIKRINTLLGLHVPILTTPLELMGEIS